MPEVATPNQAEREFETGTDESFKNANATGSDPQREPAGHVRQHQAHLRCVPGSGHPGRAPVDGRADPAEPDRVAGSAERGRDRQHGRQAGHPARRCRGRCPVDRRTQPGDAWCRFQPHRGRRTGGTAPAARLAPEARITGLSSSVHRASAAISACRMDCSPTMLAVSTAFCRA